MAEPFLALAAALLAGVAVAHSYLGERHILIRLFRRGDLPNLFGSDVFTRRTIRFAWHLTSVAWLGFALVLLAPDRPQHVLLAISATFGLSALATFVASRGRHLAWPVFAVIAVLAFMGAAAYPT